MDKTPVTNLQFGQFVEATGHITLAEIAPTIADYPDADPALLRAGSAVFRGTTEPVTLNDHSRWWIYKFGASWRDPWGDGRGIAHLPNHPVVQIAYADALAYAAWAGKKLPSEVQWEYAARAGSDLPYLWGNTLEPDGNILANYWRGDFPWRNLSTHAATGTSPVGSFPPNRNGLYDMIGNVWEWTTSVFTTSRASAPSCCSPPCAANNAPPLVLKGGSYLCAANYCRRYRPAARHSQMADSPTNHIGFRCIAIAPTP